MTYDLEELAEDGSYKLSKTVDGANAPDSLIRLAMARGVARVIYLENPMATSTIMLQITDVFNASGDRSHVNLDLHVRGIDYATALKVRDYAKQTHGLDLHVSQIFPNSADVNTFAMFTAAGALALRDMLDDLEVGLRAGDLPAQKLLDEVEKRQAVIAADGHHEIFDTAVREVTWNRLDAVLEELGLKMVNA